MLGVLAFVVFYYTTIKMPSDQDVDSLTRQIEQQLVSRHDPTPLASLPPQITADATLTQPVMNPVARILQKLGFQCCQARCIDHDNVAHSYDWADGSHGKVALVSLPDNYFVAKEWRSWYSVIAQTLKDRPEHLWIFTDATKVHKLALYEPEELKRFTKGETTAFLFGRYWTDRMRSANFADSELELQLKLLLNIP